MSRKKDDTGLTEALAAFSYLTRHRGPINLMGKKIDQIKLGPKTWYLDNRIPALIDDVFGNLGYEQKDGQRPVLAAKRKTEYGWYLIYNLPPGVSYANIRKDLGYFQDATNSFIALQWKHGKVHMDVQIGELPEYVEYSWSAPSGLYLPIPIGFSRTKLMVLNLPDSPHLIIGGATGYGKTSAVISIIHSIVGRAIVVIIDLKRVDFEYLRDKVILAITNEEAHAVLLALQKEFYQRTDLLRQHRVRKIMQLADPPPYIVLVVDEIAELSAENMELLDRLVRLARATGISIIAASQRTSVKVIPGDTRSNFVARMCFKVPSEADSRVILGEDCGLAGLLPDIKGRCIYRMGAETLEVQSMYLSEEKAELLANDLPLLKGWEGIERNAKPEPAVKRLTPR